MQGANRSDSGVLSRGFALEALLASKGFSVSVGYVSTGVQGGGGCTFFALSAVKIMAKSPQIDSLHRQLLAWAPHPGDSTVIHQAIIEPFSLEPAFFKHATSQKLIDRYFKDKGNKKSSLISRPVNKKGDTLPERVKAHMTVRVKPDGDGTLKVHTPLARSWFLKSKRARKAEYVFLLSKRFCMACADLGYRAATASQVSERLKGAIVTIVMRAAQVRHCTPSKAGVPRQAIRCHFMRLIK